MDISTLGIVGCVLAPLPTVKYLRQKSLGNTKKQKWPSRSENQVLGGSDVAKDLRLEDKDKDL